MKTDKRSPNDSRTTVALGATEQAPQEAPTIKSIETISHELAAAEAEYDAALLSAIHAWDASRATATTDSERLAAKVQFEEQRARARAAFFAREGFAGLPESELS